MFVVYLHTRKAVCIKNMMALNHCASRASKRREKIPNLNKRIKRRRIDQQHVIDK